MADPRVLAQADQFQAELLDAAKALLEEALHMQGLCINGFDKNGVMLIESALKAGSTATVAVLLRHGRIAGMPS